MDWTLWPQYIAAFWLALPIFSQPAFRLAGVHGVSGKSTTRVWAIGYASTLITNAVVAYVLYAGGFWS